MYPLNLSTLELPFLEFRPTFASERQFSYNHFVRHGKIKLVVVGKGKTSQPVNDAEAQGFFPPSTDAPPSAPSPPMPCDLPRSAVHQFQAQLRQQQSQREQVHLALETQLNQVTKERKEHELVDHDAPIPIQH